ncbi:MAG TPA: TolC family protein, partial [Pirellulales bacterium]|nr:TolC family protein [Pirellulales bacterium]
SNYRALAELDQVRFDVASAYARIHSRFAQLTVAEQAVQSGRLAFSEDLNRIRAREGLPIEVLDSMRLVARARIEYLTAITEYNRAHFEMYVALGQPPADMLARPIPPELVQPGAEPNKPLTGQETAPETAP